MFKAKNKKVIALMFTLISFTLSSTRVFGNFLPMDGLLQRIANVGDYSVSKINKSAIAGDLFLSLYNNNTTSPKQSSFVNAINDVREDIIKQNINQCQLTNNDILIILMQQQDFRKDVYDNSDIPLSTSLTMQGSVQESCNKVLYCYGGKKEYIIDTYKEIKNCEDIIYSNYKVKKELGIQYLSQPGPNHNDSIYMDGNDKNAPFDLLNDIQDIRAILFQEKNPPSPPEMIYYSMPETISTTELDNNEIPGNIFAIGGGGSNNSKPTNNPSGENNHGSDNIDIDTKDLNGITNNDSVINNFIRSNNNIASHSAESSMPTSIIQAPLCPTPNNNATNIPETLTSSLAPIKQFTQAQSQLFDTLSGILFHAPSDNDLTSLDNVSNTIVGGENNIDNRIQTKDPSLESIQCTAECKDTEQEVQKQICEGNCCIKACDKVSNIGKKAICISQCLCGEIATKNDELRIKFCRVPAQVTRVIANKKVSNIEQIIDAINSIFHYLKNNELMTKRTKTKELLDSSFSDIKFSQILSFDIFVAFKPLYDKISFSQFKENKKKENIATQEAIHPLGTKLGDMRDKSKYVVLGNHAKIKAQKEIYTSFNQFSDNVRDLSKTYCQQQGLIRITNNNGTEECNDNQHNLTSTTLEQKNLLSISNNETSIAQINDNIYKFINQNYMFWEQIDKSINDMLTTSSVLRGKAESAK